MCELQRLAVGDYRILHRVDHNILVERFFVLIELFGVERFFVLIERFFVFVELFGVKRFFVFVELFGVKRFFVLVLVVVELVIELVIELKLELVVRRGGRRGKLMAASMPSRSGMSCRGTPRICQRQRVNQSRSTRQTRRRSSSPIT